MKVIEATEAGLPPESTKLAAVPAAMAKQEDMPIVTPKSNFRRPTMSESRAPTTAGIQPVMAYMMFKSS